MIKTVLDELVLALAILVAGTLAGGALYQVVYWFASLFGLTS